MLHLGKPFFNTKNMKHEPPKKITLHHNELMLHVTSRNTQLKSVRDAKLLMANFLFEALSLIENKWIIEAQSLYANKGQYIHFSSGCEEELSHHFFTVIFFAIKYFQIGYWLLDMNLSFSN